MKKSILVLNLCLVLLVSMGVMATAFVHNENIEVIFVENSIFSDNEKEIIKEYFNNENDGNNVYGLKCTLFGHDYKTEYVDVIRHKVRATQPRCIKDKYETKICVDCSDTVSTLIATTSITCCD